MSDPTLPNIVLPPSQPAKFISYYAYDAGGNLQSGLAELTDDFKEKLSKAGWTLVQLEDGDVAPTAHTHIVDGATGALTAKQPTAPPLKIRVKIDEITLACAATMTGGFYSSALSDDGKTHYFYPSKDTDQLNMLHGGRLVCKAPDGSWAPRDHTDAQAGAVRSQFRALRDTARTKKTAMLAQVGAATTADQLAAIVWGRDTPVGMK